MTLLASASIFGVMDTPRVEISTKNSRLIQVELELKLLFIATLYRRLIH